MEVKSARCAYKLAFDMGNGLTAFEVAAGIGHITAENDLGEKRFLLLRAATFRQLFLCLS